MPGQGFEKMFFIGHKAFFAAKGFLLPTRLVMQLNLFCNGLIKGCIAKELLIAQAGMHTHIEQLYLVLNQGFVFGFGRAGGYNGTTVMVGKIFQGTVNIRFIVTGLCNC